ncbi:hypothetical protein BEWA_009310 [Theileria equi strain WA]|uniref:Uncharacterized protein n=1 Tax=Theileria equi strain WA TaxID=1537102 RepID=L0B203_THEEQ|nr:hypothetical protein BEWA_009310 [Theileria equi strain WA]AFZ81518.1 hypothetical protein BEWA_009310 [Theileria equi strain WA]|eukprot:XP_004831184.1 hypothetical protein BEWA_009310 [Theileria equi strain WA]
MSQRILKVTTFDTAPPLLPQHGVAKRALASQVGNNRLLPENLTKVKNTAEIPKSLRCICPSQDTLKIKSKIRSISYNSTGSRLYIATRDVIYLLNTQTLAVDFSLSVKCTMLIAHPKLPDCFALLLQGTNSSKPSVKIYEVKKNTKNLKGELVVTHVITSAFEDSWYTGCWSLDGRFIALVDRDDILQFVDLNECIQNVNKELQKEHSIKLDCEAYGLLYTLDSLIIQRVDGAIQIINDSKDSIVERAHSHIVTAASFSKSTNILATGGSDHVVNIFDINEDYTCVGTFPRIEGQISSLSFSTDGTFLAWGTKDTAATLDLQAGSYSTTSDLSMHRDDKLGGSGNDVATEDFSLTVAAINPCEIYYQHNTPCSVTHVAFSPNKYVIAYACDFDAFPKSGHSTHSNLVGFLHL